MAPSSGKSAGGAICLCFPTFSICWGKRPSAQSSHLASPCRQPAIANSSVRLCIARCFAYTNSFAQTGKTGRSIPRRLHCVQDDSRKAECSPLCAVGGPVAGNRQAGIFVGFLPIRRLQFEGNLVQLIDLRQQLRRQRTIKLGKFSRKRENPAFHRTQHVVIGCHGATKL